MFGQSGRSRTSIMRAKFSRTAIVLRSELKFPILTNKEYWIFETLIINNNCAIKNTMKSSLSQRTKSLYIKFLITINKSII